MTGKEKKIQRSFMLSVLCLDCLKRLKEKAYPELSYSQIVEQAIFEFGLHSNV
jgi:hypothetical protein